MDILIKNTAGELLNKVAGNKFENRDQLIGTVQSVLSNASAIELANSNKMANSQSSILAKVIELKSRVMLEDTTEARSDLIYLNKSREWGNVIPVSLGDIILPWSRDYKRGEVTIGADHSNSTPTQGFEERNYDDMVTIKPITAAIEIGYFELRNAARDGIDMIANEIRERQYDMDLFVERKFFDGLPQFALPGYFTTLNAPKILVEESTVNAGKTRWTDKTPTEILADLKRMREQSKLMSKTGLYPSVIQVSTAEFTYLSTVRMGDGNAPTVLEQWTKEMLLLANPSLSFPQVATEIMPLPFLDGKGIADADGATGVAVTTRFGAGTYAVRYGNKQRTELQQDGWTYKMGLWAPFGGVSAKKDSGAIWFEGI